MNKKVLVIDNYDSFTYNLVHYMEDLDYEVSVVRNDEFSMDFVEKFDKILISPGPGIPDEAGQTTVSIKGSNNATRPSDAAYFVFTAE